MGLLDSTADYPALLGLVLSHTYGVDLRLWQQATNAVDALWGEPLPVVDELESGLLVWEVWHEGVPAKLYCEAYAALGGAPLPKQAEVVLYGVGLYAVYQVLTASGKIAQGERINVAALVDSVAFAGCMWAQHEGLPLYTVVGAQEHDVYRKAQRNHDKESIWQPIAAIAEGKDWQEAFPDVLVGQIDREDRMAAIAALYDEEGYLLHPQSAMAYAIATEYRQESEARHRMVVIALQHPYEDIATVYDAVFEEEMKEESKALQRLEEETGWELPEPLPTKELIRERVRKLSGDTL